MDFKNKIIFYQFYIIYSLIIPSLIYYLTYEILKTDKGYIVLVIHHIMIFLNYEALPVIVAATTTKNHEKDFLVTFSKFMLNLSMVIIIDKFYGDRSILKSYEDIRQKTNYQPHKIL